MRNPITQAAVGRDHVEGQDRVARPTMEAREVAEAAAERQAGDAGVRDEAENGSQAMELRLTVDVAEEATNLRAGDATRRVHPHAAHERHVEGEPAVAHAEAGDVVTAAFDRERHAVGACEVDAGDDVGSAEAAEHGSRAPVDHAVPEGAGGVVGGIGRRQKRATNLRSERVER
jgi:hypothetical protein